MAFLISCSFSPFVIKTQTVWHRRHGASHHRHSGLTFLSSGLEHGWLRTGFSARAYNVSVTDTLHCPSFLATINNDHFGFWYKRFHFHWVDFHSTSRRSKRAYWAKVGGLKFQQWGQAGGAHLTLPYLPTILYQFFLNRISGEPIWI